MFGNPHVVGRSIIFCKPSHDHFLTSFGLTENLLHKEPRIKRMIYILHLFLCSHGLDSKTVTSAGGRRLVQLSCKHNNNFLKSSTNRKLPIHHISVEDKKSVIASVGGCGGGLQQRLRVAKYPEPARG